MAVKITATSYAAKQLQSFIESLGIKSSVSLYKYDDKVYIDMSPLIRILSVDFKDFAKTSERKVHYIVIKKVPYVNKYGITKLISLSKQEVAFKLQDYLYELFYLSETKGEVSHADLTTRSAFLDSISEAESLSSIIDEENKKVIDEAYETIATLKCDLSVVESKYQNLLNDYKILSEKSENDVVELDNLRDISNKLARYVKIKSKKPPDVVFSECLDTIDEEVSDLDEDEKKIIVKDAVESKKKIRKRITKTSSTSSSTSSSDLLYIYYSNLDEVTGKCRWYINDIEESDHTLFTTIPYSVEKRKMLSVIFQLDDYDESTIEQLLS